MDPPALSAASMRELDRLAIEEVGIPSLILMENAGLRTSELALQILRTLLTCPAPSARVGIVCGKGNNGGDGMVVARHLANHGVNVSVYLLCSLGELRGDARIQAEIVKRMNIPVAEIHLPECLDRWCREWAAQDLLVDAIFGTGFSGDLKEPALSVIGALNSAARPVLAIDLPSGLDADTGRVATAAVKARWTATLGCMKKGLLAARGPAHAGQVTVIDISIPPFLLGRV